MPASTPATRAKKSIRKGKGFEYQCVQLAKKAFELVARRSWGSDGRSIGHVKEVDMVVEGWRIQAKIRARIPKDFQIPEGCDAVVFREDYGATFMFIQYRQFLALLKELKDTKAALEKLRDQNRSIESGAI
jgi:hypothetical protein